MFTGIVTETATVTDVRDTNDGRRVVVEGSGFGDIEIGDSVAVDGVCLTAVAIEGGRVSFEVVPETLSRSTLGEMTPGTKVNIELPMGSSGRFDGHMVQGHIDGVGEVVSVNRSAPGITMTIRAPQGLLGQIVEKGSIAVNGVSLTVAGMKDDQFSVALIPHTLEITNLGLRKPGDPVNLETDIIAKYVEKMLRASQ
ncbi:MAG: riboflavin synthase [Acidimicrobiia bacterium]|nr:riboflavin synthase [Acidimicrobiia bacterium]